MKQFMQIGWILCVCVSIAGCSLTKPVRIPEIKRYSLASSVSLPRAHQDAAHLRTLLIATPRPSPGYATDSMVFVDDNHQIQSYRTHRWVSSLGPMLTARFATSLGARLQGWNVVSMPYTGASDVRLETSVVYFHRRFCHGLDEAEVNIEARLFRVSDGRLLRSRTFISHQSCRDGSMRAFVEAMDQALCQLEADLSDWCRF